MKLWIAALLLAVAGPAADPERVSLWPNGAPGSESHRGEKEVAQDYWVNNIHDPSVTVFRPEHPNGTAVIIAPGGDASLPQGARDAELIMSMSINEDYPGIVGAITGIRQRGGFEDMAGALAAAATVVLQYEAIIGGRS